MNDQYVMEVLVTVNFPEIKTLPSEKAWEEDILRAVSSAVYADKTIDTKSIKQLDYDDCKWVLECGLPIQKYGVTIRQDGSWHTGLEVCPTNPETFGEDMKSLFEYLAENGLIEE